MDETSKTDTTNELAEILKEIKIIKEIQLECSSCIKMNTGDIREIKEILSEHSYVIVENSNKIEDVTDKIEDTNAIITRLTKSIDLTITQLDHKITDYILEE